MSVFGSLVTRAALPFTAAIALHATAAQMAVLGGADLIASLLVGLWAGAWVDRTSRRPLMVACDIARAALLALIPIAAFTGHLDLTLLIAVKFSAGAFDTLFDLARDAYVPGLVGERRLINANARLSATASAAEVSGFGIAGWLVQWLTGPVTIALDALSFVVSAVLLGRIRASEPEPVVTTCAWSFRAWRAEVREGLVATFHDPLQRALALSDALLHLTFGLFAACYVLYVTRELALSPGPLGMVFAVGGVSGLLVASVVSRLGRWITPGQAMVFGLAVGSFGLLLATLAPARATALALGLLVIQQFVGDGGWALYMIHSSSIRMARAPAPLRGRIGSAARMLSTGANICGLVLGGTLGDRLGSREMLVAGALVTVVAAVALGRSAAARVRRTVEASES